MPSVDHLGDTVGNEAVGDVGIVERGERRRRREEGGREEGEEGEEGGMHDYRRCAVVHRLRFHVEHVVVGVTPGSRRAEVCALASAPRWFPRCRAARDGGARTPRRGVAGGGLATDLVRHHRVASRRSSGGVSIPVRRLHQNVLDRGCRPLSPSRCLVTPALAAAASAGTPAAVGEAEITVCGLASRRCRPAQPLMRRSRRAPRCASPRGARMPAAIATASGTIGSIDGERGPPTGFGQSSGQGVFQRSGAPRRQFGDVRECRAHHRPVLPLPVDRGPGAVASTWRSAQL